MRWNDGKQEVRARGRQRNWVGLSQASVEVRMEQALGAESDLTVMGGNREGDSGTPKVRLTYLITRVSRRQEIMKNGGYRDS